MVEYGKFIDKILNSNDEKNVKNCFLKYIDNNIEKSLEFLEEFKNIKEKLEEDVDFFMESDPAIDSKEEVIIAYPGYLAISYYRIANVLRNMNYNLQSRIITELAHSKTGIDIHPGATIDSPFFIDHGTGIVIGETTIIGKKVKIYQGVTLGALSLSKGMDLKGVKRHPTIGNEVTIYAGASILGNVMIGDDVTIGSNVFLTENIPAHVQVTISKPVLKMKEKIEQNK